MGEVVGLNVYPLKGALPVTVDGTAPTTLEVRPSGLAAVGEGYDYGDREFFIAAREADGEWAVVTPRGWPSDNNKVVYLGDRFLSGVGTNVNTRNGVLELSYGNSRTHLGSWALSEVDYEESKWVPVKLHGGTVMGVDMGNSAARFIKGVIGREARVMYNPRGAVRQLRDGVDSEAKAADGYPFLVTVTGSLAALNRQHGSNTPMKRYRPNIEIDIGEVDFDENGLLPEDWAQTFEVGGHLLEVASACGRCIVTNLDKGERVGDGLPTIRSRYGVKLDPDGEPLPGSEGKFFGDSANLLVYSKDGTTLSIGNTASITTVSEYPHIQLRQSRK